MGHVQRMPKGKAKKEGATRQKMPLHKDHNKSIKFIRLREPPSIYILTHDKRLKRAMNFSA